MLGAQEAISIIDGKTIWSRVSDILLVSIMLNRFLQLCFATNSLFQFFSCLWLFGYSCFVSRTEKVLYIEWSVCILLSDATLVSKSKLFILTWF